MDILTGLALGAVEGLTEFLPVSSTGHLILAGELLGFSGEKASIFEVVIQLGAVFAVACLYRKRLRALGPPRGGPARRVPRFAGWRGLWMLRLTTLPPALLGLAAHGAIKALFTPASVCLALAVGAVCMLLTELRGEGPLESLDDLTPKLALGIGLFQCLALWPGFSRAAATIMGGMLLGARRTVAAEYSFLAAIPLLCAAAAYDLLKNRHLLDLDDALLLAWGGLVSFLFAILAVKGFISLLGRTSLRPFAFYRLLLAALTYCLLAG
jgi:undecaprenyl-diphosphatase